MPCNFGCLGSLLSFQPAQCELIPLNAGCTDACQHSTMHPDQPDAAAPRLIERLASSWLGALAAESPERPATNFDHLAHAVLARLTGGMSPASMWMAWQDWALHLSMSPSKQMQLVEKAMRKWNRLLLYTAKAHSAQCPACIEPLPQDKRFADPDWQQWPFNLIYQSFLLQQQWWWNATTGVSGVSRHHEQLVTFAARQLLDMVAPSNFLATNPTVLKQTELQFGANLLQGAVNAVEDLQRRASNAPPCGAEAFVVGGNVALTPGKVVFRNHLIELIQYAPAGAQTYAEPVLIVPAWIMKYYVLDLSPENSLVRYLVSQGHTVFIISWRNPGAEDRELGMEDYRRMGPMAALDTIAARLPQHKIHLVGYCLGGTLAAIVAAAMARDKDPRLASLTLLAAQVDFEEPGELSLFIDESQLAFLDNVMWNQGYLDATQMAGAFQWMRSNDLVWSYRLSNYLLGTRRPMTDLMAWNADATRLPFRMHSEYLRKLFLDNDLAEGRYQVDEQPISISDIRLPTFAVGTLTDHVAPWRSVYKIHRLSDTDVSFVLTTGGHNVGIVSPPGRTKQSYQFTARGKDEHYVDPDSWQNQAERHTGSWWPAWQQWLVAHSGDKVSAPRPEGKRNGKAPPDDAPGRYVLMR